MLTSAAEMSSRKSSKSPRNPMQRMDGFVLIGGRSSRMGRDKAELVLGGETFADRAVHALQGISEQVRIVGGNSNTDGLAGISDVYPNWGALGGLHAALTSANKPWAAVLACDLPFVSQQLLERLANLRGDFEAVAPIQSDEIPQPLCALYRVKPCRARAAALIESGERRPIALLQSVCTRWVEFKELADLEGSSHFFDNINTPDDYARAAAKGGHSLPS